MSSMISTLRNASLLGVIILFALTLLFFTIFKLFNAAVVLAISFGLMGLVLVVLTLRLEEPWIQRVFFAITGISAAAIPISVVLHNLVYAIGILFFGEGFWSGSDEPFFFILAIIVFPGLFVIGSVGSAVLLVRSKLTKTDKA